MTSEELTTLRTQLSLLNARSNYREDHAWKMPLAIMALVGALIIQVAEKFPCWLWPVGIVSAVFALGAVLHFLIIWHGLHMTASRIEEIEGLLELPRIRPEGFWVRLRRLLPRLY